MIVYNNQCINLYFCTARNFKTSILQSKQQNNNTLLQKQFLETPHFYLTVLDNNYHKMVLRRPSRIRFLEPVDNSIEIPNWKAFPYQRSPPPRPLLIGVHVSFPAASSSVARLQVAPPPWLQPAALPHRPGGQCAPSLPPTKAEFFNDGKGTNRMTCGSYISFTTRMDLGGMYQVVLQEKNEQY